MKTYIINKMSLLGKFVLMVVSVLTVILLFYIVRNQQRTTETGILDWGIRPLYENEGNASHGIRPGVLFGMNHDDWNVEIQFTPLTNYPSGTWFVPVNYFNCTLALCGTNGSEVELRRSARHQMQLLNITTISNLYRSVDLSRRGSYYTPGEAGGGFQSAQFHLSSVFDVPFDRDYILEVKPVLYCLVPNQQHVKFTLQLVQLLEFAPIRVKLKANGDVEQLK